jgi:hypothetical protein
MNTRQHSVVGVALAMAALATGCLDRELKPLNPCLVSGVSRQVQVQNVDKVDLLFMVDNSNSMAGEQQSLKDQFPKVISVLTTGYRFEGDPQPFPAVKDLHVGIVDSDMGIPGVEYPPCHADGGDDGKLQHAPHGAACDAQYPPFLSFIGDAKIGPVTDPVKFSSDVGCIATLGTGGCGFEEQLESPFKALWPSVYTDPAGNVKPNPFVFISINQPGTMGKGDVPAAQGGNLGFLRNTVADGLSLIAVVVVTDEEDCSVSKTDHLRPTNQLEDASPYRKEDINLRCYYHPEFSYSIEERYLKGFRMLRQGNEKLVVFAAITGVPTDLVDKAALPDFTDDAARNSFYDNILGDPRMQQVPDSMVGTGQGNLVPSCVRMVAGDPMPSTAYPPQRIVQLAKAFGTNGIVQSICQDDFGPAMEAIINIIANQLGEVCLPRPLVRQSSGKVACNVVWELPKTKPNGAATPLDCSELPYLGPVDEGRAPLNAAGGKNCKVKQLPVVLTDSQAKTAPAGEGWFYDDYTTDVVKTCSKTQQQRVAFTADAKPPTGVTVKLECLNETQKLASTRTDLRADQPEIGTSCGMDVAGNKVSGDAACVVTSLSNVVDTSMFCHPELNTCVRSCISDTDCPPAWVCDKRPETLQITQNKAFCVNPTCGADTTTD